jgi:streptogramin lyase
MRFIALLTALAALALPVGAQAGITEYPIEPGAAPGVHAPLYLAPALDGNYLWYTDDGTARAVGRSGG